MKISVIIILMCTASVVYGQKTIPTIGAGAGIGSMFGNFPSQTTFGGKLFFESGSPVRLFERIQYNLTFAQKIEKFLPGSYNYQHYSYFTSLGISGLFNQKLSPTLFIEEGIGIIYLNDRSFNDIDSWNWGILLNLVTGFDLKNNLELTFNLDYGITLNKTNVSYVLIFLGLNYNL